MTTSATKSTRKLDSFATAQALDKLASKYLGQGLGVAEAYRRAADELESADGSK